MDERRWLDGELAWTVSCKEALLTGRAIVSSATVRGTLSTGETRWGRIEETQILLPSIFEFPFHSLNWGWHWPLPHRVAMRVK